MPDKQIPNLPHVLRTGALNVTLTTPNRVDIETANGQKITIQGDEQGVTIQDQAGGSVQLQAGSIQIRASAQVSIECSSVKISAAMITVDSAMTKFSGTVQADTVITNSVVASSYTPGAGNVW